MLIEKRALIREWFIASPISTAYFLMLYQSVRDRHQVLPRLRLWPSIICITVPETSGDRGLEKYEKPKERATACRTKAAILELNPTAL